MTNSVSAPETLEKGRMAGGLDLQELWLECFAMGFNGSVGRLQDILDGTERLSRSEYDLIAQCLNERLREAGDSELVPYADEIDL